MRWWLLALLMATGHSSQGQPGREHSKGAWTVRKEWLTSAMWTSSAWVRPPSSCHVSNKVDMKQILLWPRQVLVSSTSFEVQLPGVLAPRSRFVQTCIHSALMAVFVAAMSRFAEGAEEHVPRGELCLQQLSVWRCRGWERFSWATCGRSTVGLSQLKANV